MCLVGGQMEEHMGSLATEQTRTPPVELGSQH